MRCSSARPRLDRSGDQNRLTDVFGEGEIGTEYDFRIRIEDAPPFAGVVIKVQREQIEAVTILDGILEHAARRSDGPGTRAEEKRGLPILAGGEGSKAAQLW